MQRKLRKRKIVEAYEDDMQKKPHVTDKKQLENMEELELEPAKYNISLNFYNDQDKTCEIVAYDKETNVEQGRLLCRNLEDLGIFMDGGYHLFAESGGNPDNIVICTIKE